MVFAIGIEKKPLPYLTHISPENIVMNKVFGMFFNCFSGK